MGVYIKGMEMPKGCATCPYCDRAWNKPKCKAKSVQGRFMEQRLNLDRTRQKWCPLAPVPEHGRLVDGDKLDGYLKTAAIMADGEAKEAYIDARAEAKTMPTIIPADHIGDVNEMVADKEGEG